MEDRDYLVRLLAGVPSKVWRTLATQMMWYHRSQWPTSRLPWTLRNYRHLCDTPEVWAEVAKEVNTVRRREGRRKKIEQLVQRADARRIYMRDYMRRKRGTA